MRAIQMRFEQPEGIDPPTAIVVVVPESLDNLLEFQSEVREQLEKGFPRKVVESKLVVSEQGEARTVTYVERVVVDVPRTVFPLRRSKRVVRLREQLNDPELAEEMEQKLLARFMSTLKNMADNSKDIASNRLHVVRLGQLIDRVKAVARTG
jgi:hypothetical protein